MSFMFAPSNPFSQTTPLFPFSQTTPLKSNPNIKLNATLNAIYEVYNINHVKCEVDDCCVKCAENFKIIKEYKHCTGFRIIDSHDWIKFCMNKLLQME